MSSQTFTRECAIDTLKTFAAFQKERNGALSDLARTSSEMRAVLENDPACDIRELLQKREKQCMKYAELCREQSNADELIREAESAARCGEREPAAAGMLVLSLYENAQDLAEQIMTCQAECETILRNRLKTTARALQQSAQRRRLDAAYGPAHKHSAPVFMDKVK